MQTREGFVQRLSRQEGVPLETKGCLRCLLQFLSPQGSDSQCGPNMDAGSALGSLAALRRAKCTGPETWVQSPVVQLCETAEEGLWPPKTHFSSQV